MKIDNKQEADDKIIVQKLSADGVFFRCGNCYFEPEMKSKTDDLLNMNYCPNCGSKFYNYDKKCICIKNCKSTLNDGSNFMIFWAKPGDVFYYKRTTTSTLIQHREYKEIFYTIDNEQFNLHFTDMQLKRKNILKELLK